MADIDDTAPQGGGAEDAQPSEGMTLEQAMEAAWDETSKGGEGEEGTGSDAPEDDGGGAPKDTPAPKDGDGAPGSDADKGTPEPLKAPEQWDAAAKDLFAKQPREAQQWMLDRHAAMEGDYTRKSQDAAPYRDTAQRWSEYVARTGQRPEELVDGLLRVDQVLRHGSNEQATRVLESLAQDRGFKLVKDGEPSAGKDDPLGEEIRRHQAPVMDAIKQLRESITAREAADERAGAERARAEVAAFQEEKDAEGNLKHPHFEEVRATMAQLAQTERLSGRPGRHTRRCMTKRAGWCRACVRGWSRRSRCRTRTRSSSVPSSSARLARQ